VSKEKKLLFSVTAKDCEWSYTKGTGAGGQKRNKTSSAVHCMHRPSGARGYSEASRSQADNKRDAFVKMANTVEFRRWNQLEAMKKMGQLEELERKLEEDMKPWNLRYETKVDGVWTETAPEDMSRDESN
jgi:protein subunit release factor B